MDTDTKTPDVSIVDNRAASRWEATFPDGIAIATYDRDGDAITFTHTEVPPSMEGKGIASALARAALAQARADGLQVVVKCPFFTTFIKRHAEYQDLLTPRT